MEYGNEWFVESEEMFSFLQECTLEDLEKLPLSLPSQQRNSKLIKSWKVMKLLDYVLRQERREEYGKEDYKNMLQVVNYEHTTLDLIFEDLRLSNHFPSLISKTWNEVKDELFSSIPSEVLQFFSRIRFLNSICR